MYYFTLSKSVAPRGWSVNFWDIPCLPPDERESCEAWSIPFDIPVISCNNSCTNFPTWSVFNTLVAHRVAYLLASFTHKTTLIPVLVLGHVANRCKLSNEWRPKMKTNLCSDLCRVYGFTKNMYIWSSNYMYFICCQWSVRCCYFFSQKKNGETCQGLDRKKETVLWNLSIGIRISERKPQVTSEILYQNWIQEYYKWQRCWTHTTSEFYRKQQPWG